MTWSSRLVSYPKCGTTWLKALAFAVVARTRPRPTGAEHPLHQLNRHDGIPFIKEIIAGGEEAKLDALLSPWLMNTRLPHPLLPEPVMNGGCKVMYIFKDPKGMVALHVALPLSRRA
ncbi:hypothetical protein EJB05_00207, partial [Eragrostis curvula]